MEDYFQKLIGLIPGVIIERKKYGLSLHYRMIGSEKDSKFIVEEARKYARDKKNFKIHEGEMVIEILPNLNWDKGKAILKIYDVLGLDKYQYPPLYIGDGKTDEDAFREMRHWGVSILSSIDPRPSLASYSLHGPEEVKVFLNILLNYLRGFHAQVDSRV